MQTLREELEELGIIAIEDAADGQAARDAIKAVKETGVDFEAIAEELERKRKRWNGRIG